MLKNIKAFFLLISRRSSIFAADFKTLQLMAKKKSELEQLFSDYRKAQKTTKCTITRLEGIIHQQAEQIEQLQNELEHEKENKDLLLTGLLGENADRAIDGYDFERHVAWWMKKHQPHLTLEMWQGDKFAHPYMDDEIICPLWNKYPDLIYSEDGKKEIIAVECKYRYDGILEINNQKFEKYKSFESHQGNLMSKNIKVYISSNLRVAI